jgi:hypothetical protein
MGQTNQTTVSKNTETIGFAIHPAVIRQLIENQAGTLSKAVLEGVMNGIDAMRDLRRELESRGYAAEKIDRMFRELAASQRDTWFEYR